MEEVSQHRALASAQNGYDASDNSPHSQAVQKVTLPTPSPDNTQKPTVKPVNLGQDQTKTSMTIVGDEKQGFSGLATNK